MSRAQIVFALALAAVTGAVLVVGAYVGSSATWGRRWYSAGRIGRIGRIGRRQSRPDGGPGE